MRFGLPIPDWLAVAAVLGLASTIAVAAWRMWRRR